jgi:hypothetical protein
MNCSKRTMIGEYVMNIKVNRLKLIAALKVALQERVDLQIANDNIAQLNKSSLEAYEQKVLELIYTGKLELNYMNTQNWRQEPSIEVSFKMPKNFRLKPVIIDTEFVRTYEVVELENAIKLLEMSDVETVSAGTYKSVVGYIK